MHLQVYIDTSSYLDLLATSVEVSDEMSKILALCENGSIDIFLPQQTALEYASNREDVVFRASEQLQKYSSVGALPALVENHALSADAAQSRRDLADAVSTVRAWYVQAARNRELPFDLWFSKIKGCATHLKSTDALIALAKQRADTHLPPGKGDDFGDRLIWETLLGAGAFSDDLHIITKDNKDYRCPLNPTELRQKLREEWKEINFGNTYIYESIPSFLTEIGSNERYSRAVEIGRAIWMLRSCSDQTSIDTSMSILSRNVVVFSQRQINLVAQAAKAYSDRVFLTCDSFDEFISEFWRHYEKYLQKKEAQFLQNLVIPREMVRDAVKSVANRN